MNIADLFVRAARVYPDKPAISLGDHTYATYSQLAANAAAVAAGLTQRHGLVAGDRVAIIMANVPRTIEVMLSCWFAGLTAVPMNAKLHHSEYAYMLADCGAKLVFATPGLMTSATVAAADLKSILEVINTDSPAYEALYTGERCERYDAAATDIAWLFYTSGTTGRPKGAMLSHRNLLAMSTSYFIDIDHISAQDNILHAAPLSHGSGLYAIPHAAAMAGHIIPESGGFDCDEILFLTRKHSGITMFGAPTMVNRLVHHPATADSDLSGLKTIVYGGAPMHVADVKQALDVLGPHLAQLYGQGESPMCITGLSKRWYGNREHPNWEHIIGSAGLAQTVVSVETRTPEGAPLPPGEVGEICVKGDSVMAGYWGQPDVSAETLRGGWLHTGDIGSFDSHGFLTLLDRSKDLIISGGANIYPREVEEVVLRHPAIAEVSVVGRPHADWGEEVVAFVATHNGAPPDNDALDQFCRDNIARFKRPRAYIHISSLPKNSYGKILKRELRDRLL